MTGSLQIKNGHYYAVMNTKDPSGKRKQDWVATHLSVKGNNKRKAEAFLNDLKMNYISKYERKVEEQSPLFVDCIRDWLETKIGILEQSTFEGYVIYAEKHIIPYFEKLDLAIADVTPKHIYNYYNYKLNDGRCDGKEGGLSVISIAKHAVILKQVLSHAVVLELIKRNPAANVPLPQQRVPRQERIFLTAQEAQVVINAFQGHPLHGLVYITLYYGLRRSEVLGLKWNAIDFDKKTIQIQHTVVKNTSIIAKDKTKTESSKRTYMLVPEVESLLCSLKRQKESYKKDFGEHYMESDYIFTWPDGSTFRPDYVTAAFQSNLEKSGLKRMRFHDLRHSTASILYDKGLALKDIQFWLGHSDIATTADIYTHITKDRKALIAENMANTFSL